jgi:hypothetical protein
MEVLEDFRLKHHLLFLPDIFACITILPRWVVLKIGLLICEPILSGICWRKFSKINRSVTTSKTCLAGTGKIPI